MNATQLASLRKVIDWVDADTDNPRRPRTLLALNRFANGDELTHEEALRVFTTIEAYNEGIMTGWGEDEEWDEDEDNISDEDLALFDTLEAIQRLLNL